MQEFAWVSIYEAYRSTSVATSIKRLSCITVCLLEPAMYLTETHIFSLSSYPRCLLRVGLYIQMRTLVTEVNEVIPYTESLWHEREFIKGQPGLVLVHPFWRSHFDPYCGWMAHLQIHSSSSHFLYGAFHLL